MEEDGNDGDQAQEGIENPQVNHRIVLDEVSFFDPVPCFDDHNDGTDESHTDNDHKPAIDAAWFTYVNALMYPVCYMCNRLKDGRVIKGNLVADFGIFIENDIGNKTV